VNCATMRAIPFTEILSDVTSNKSFDRSQRIEDTVGYQITSSRTSHVSSFHGLNGPEDGLRRQRGLRV